jgi:hypothetical protein
MGKENKKTRFSPEAALPGRTLLFFIFLIPPKRSFGRETVLPKSKEFGFLRFRENKEERQART